jgi:hypothetical protein
MVSPCSSSQTSASTNYNPLDNTTSMHPTSSDDDQDTSALPLQTSEVKKDREFTEDECRR